MGLCRWHFGSRLDVDTAGILLWLTGLLPIHCETPGELAGQSDVRCTRCLARWLLCLALTTQKPAQPQRRGAGCTGASELCAQRPHLRRTPYVARHYVLEQGQICGLYRIDRLQPKRPHCINHSQVDFTQATSAHNSFLNEVGGPAGSQVRNAQANAMNPYHRMLTRS